VSTLRKKSIIIPGFRRALFLYNPISGDGRVGSQIDTVIKMYQKDGYMVDIVRIDGTVDLVSIFDKFDDKYSQILIGGGDGTVNSVVNEMMKREIDVPIGILPMGTANDFANYIGMTQNVEECMRQILTLPVQQMDVGKVNEVYFVNVFSLGFFTDISQKTEVDLKNTIGKLAYYLKSLELLREPKITKIKLESPDIIFDDDIYLLLVFNGVSVGGHRIAFKSVGNDGKLDLIIVKSNLNNIVPTLVKFMKGESLNPGDENSIIYIQTPYIRIDSTAVAPSDIDGEKGPDFPMEIVCLNKKLKVLGVKASI